MPLLTTGAGKYAAAASGYQGLGDVIASGWLAYYGMRSFTAASIGTDVLGLFKNPLDVETSDDFETISTGFVNTTAIEAFRDGTLYGQYYYDQVGSLDFVRTSAGTRPEYTSAGPNGTPTLTWITAVDADRMFSVGVVKSQPFSVVTIAKHIGSTANQAIFGSDGPAALYFDNGVVVAYAGGGVTATCSNNTWHSIIAVFNGTSSAVYVDGVSTTGDAGTTGLTTGFDKWALGQAPGVGFPLDGAIAELAIHNAALSSGQAATIYANHQTYYGV